MTSTLKFINPEEFNGTDLVAKISIENAKLLSKLTAKDDERKIEILKMLENDKTNGFIAEDIDED